MFFGGFLLNFCIKRPKIHNEKGLDDKKVDSKRHGSFWTLFKHFEMSFCIQIPFLTFNNQLEMILSHWNPFSEVLFQS